MPQHAAPPSPRTARKSPPAAPAPAAPAPDAESLRLAEADAGTRPWRRWGPYLADRQWGTVREDYSPDGDCWNSFPHDHARSRAYRWGEDGLLGICDDQARLCLALALWNGRDPILKERLFGLTGPEGNHGEDVKEHYFYLDSTPTHSYMKALYKYPHAEFPYARLVDENRRRSRLEPEFELSDTGAFDDNRYFDVQAEYAKDGPEDILLRITVSNRGPEPATLHLLPTLWYRNTWSWSGDQPADRRPLLHLEPDGSVACRDGSRRYRLHAQHDPSAPPPEWLFTENESNARRLWNAPNAAPHVKDAFHDRVIRDDTAAVNPAQRGTKCAPWYRLLIPAGGAAVVRLRLTAEHDATALTDPFGPGFDSAFDRRIAEANAFYDAEPRAHAALDPDARRIARQAAAGLLWTKQFYHVDIPTWLNGDPGQPAPPDSRRRGRNADWPHLNNADVISMPDGWEYPWYAAWDLAFQMIPFARLDPTFAKEQLVLLLREWYMHPNGQIPAYEFAFGDVNPPVHAWAVWRVYQLTGATDRVFLARCFQKLLLNFTWWVNRKDPSGKNLFAGGFLGLDNIGVFDRSRPLPTGGHLEQADGTAWMAFYCGTMLRIALELAAGDPAYEDIATKFFEHFIAIADAMNTLGGTGLWDETDGLYYDQISMGDAVTRLRIRSLVCLVPLLAVQSLDASIIDRLPDFKRRMQWFLDHRADLPWHAACACAHHGPAGPQRLLAIPSRQRLERVASHLLDESGFLSPHGVRSVSKVHQREPFVFHAGGQEFRVDYTPGESTTALFGGNSNWRGPVWFPINYLLIEALEHYHGFYGDSLTVQAPGRPGARLTLGQIADDLRARLVSIFRPDHSGRRPCHGDDPRFAADPHWQNLLYFHEYFHGDTGRGLGASHQTGWTALVLELLRPA